MKTSDLTNKELVKIYKLLKEGVALLEDEKGKLEELTNGAKNPKPTR